jgi:hypothetical protein
MYPCAVVFAGSHVNGENTGPVRKFEALFQGQLRQEVDPTCCGHGTLRQGEGGSDFLQAWEKRVIVSCVEN